MKKLVYGGLFLALVGIGFIACQKKNEIPAQESISSILAIEEISNKELLNSIISDINSLEKAPPNWWVKVKKWFKDHTGTHLFDSCQGSNPCGPCPGICISLGVIGGEENDGDVVSPSDYALGLRAFGLYLVENRITLEESVLFVFNDDINDFLNDNRLVIDRDINANDNVVNALGKKSIELKKGIYPVTLDTISGYYFSLVDSKIK